MSIERTLRTLDILDSVEEQCRRETVSSMADGSAWAAVAIDSITNGEGIPEMLASAVLDLVALGLPDETALSIVQMVSKVSRLAERVDDIDEGRKAALAQSWLGQTPSG